MSRSSVSVAVLIAALTLVSALYTYYRAQVFTTSDQLARKGLVATRRETAIFYAGVTIVVGIVSYYIYRAMVRASPDAAAARFLLLAIAVGLALEMMAALVFKMKGIADFTVLHLLHIAVYGWMLPHVFPL
jgi:hypothetical protein